MSFAVVGGTSPQSTHGLSPHANIYSIGVNKTPSSSIPRVPVTALPPPFSLSATTGNDLVDMLGSAPSASHSKRIGTDPAKFKTTICRNWEQTGMCGFRGCTFAHGVDDLRPPMRQAPVVSTGERGGVSPTLGPVKVSPNASPSVHASAVHNGGHSIVTKLDSLVEQLVQEVVKDKDLSLVHQEASRTLEAMIRREQALRQNSSQQLELNAQRLNVLIKKLSEKDRALIDAIEAAKVRGVASRIYSPASLLITETQSVIQTADSCLAEYGDSSGAQLEDQQSELIDSLGCGDQKSNSNNTIPPRSYAAAVTGQRPPMGLQPIGGSPSDSQCATPR